MAKVSHPRRTVRSVGSGPWDVWADLAAREHIVWARRRLPDACGGAIYRRLADGRAIIALDDRSLSPKRRCDLAHELIHDELGSSCRCDGMPDAWDAVIAREETFIDREVARRLLPRADLVRFLWTTAGDHDHPVTVHDIADHFHVTEHIAEVAMSILAVQPQGWGEIVA